MSNVFLVVFMSLILESKIILYKTHGDVNIFDNDGNLVYLKDGDDLSPGFTIKTSSTSKAELIYEEGIMVFISESTSFTIRKNKKNSNSLTSIFDVFTTNLLAQDQESWIDYLYGKAMFFIQKLDKRYIVKTPTAVCGVRGTNFSIIATENKTEVGLFKGLLEIEKDDKKVVLKPGELAIIDRQNIKIEKRLTDIMEKERLRAIKIEKYFKSVIDKLKKREDKLKYRLDNIKKD
ncbi:MAG: FecR family protein [Elusimicrobiales bacterium]|nr:FecR family protein [Elusimicrobiales bacterium]